MREGVSKLSMFVYEGEGPNLRRNENKKLLCYGIFGIFNLFRRMEWVFFDECDFFQFGLRWG